MIMNNLNKSRYFELVAKDQNLKGKDSSLYDVNRSKYNELGRYRIILQQQVF